MGKLQHDRKKKFQEERLEPWTYVESINHKKVWEDQFIKKNLTRFNNVSQFIILYLHEVQRVVGGLCRTHTVHDNVHQLHVRQRPPTTRPTTFHVWITRGCQCSFRLLMTGGVSPETCWASYKYGIINFDALLHLFGFFFMNFTMMHVSTNIKSEKISIQEAGGKCGFDVLGYGRKK
jgi:hypothetical protein